MERNDRQWHPGTPMGYRDQIVTGDARELAKRIPDESVDLIYTDPPYPLEFIGIFDDLAKYGSRVLKHGGSLLSLCGHNGLPQILRFMEECLDYVWLCGMGHGGRNAPVWPIKTWAFWKPMIWFARGKPRIQNWMQDFYRPRSPDKRFHKWGQAAEHAVYYVEHMTNPGDIILDPFTGGGTVPAVCKMLDRHYIAFEIDPEVAETARKRVYNAQPSLPMEVPIQDSWTGKEDTT